VGAAVLGAITGNPARSVVAVISVIVLLVTGFTWRSVDSLRSNLTVAAGLGLGGAEDGAIDILVVGVDSRTDAQGRPLSQQEVDMLHAGDVDTTSTDTIMLIRIPTDGTSATAVSIPRDTYTEVPGLGQAKINSAYGSTRAAKLDELIEAGTDPQKAEAEATEAGRQALITSVADLTGVTVDHFAEVGLLGFVLLTDAVGGVDVCLNEPVDEPMSGARFDAGPQRLTGSEALSFVRQRQHLPRGDLDRVVRQQVYLASLTRQVLSAGTLSNPSRLGRLSSAVERSVVIDDGWDIIEFAQQMQSLSGGSVRFETVPVLDPSGMSEDGESIVVVDPLEVEAFFAEMVGREPSEDARRARAEQVEAIDIDPAAVTVDVRNAGPVSGLAAEVAGELGSVGYRIGEVGNADSPYGASTVLVSEDSRDPGRAVARALGGLPVRTGDDLPPGTVQVVITGDYAGPGTGLNAEPITDGTAAIAPPSAPPVDADAGDEGEGDGEGPAPDPDAITAGGDGPVCVN